MHSNAIQNAAKLPPKPLPASSMEWCQLSTKLRIVRQRWLGADYEGPRENGEVQLFTGEASSAESRAEHKAPEGKPHPGEWTERSL